MPVYPSSTAGGDLSGTLPSPTVAKINGVAVTGTPSVGYVPTATSGTAATWQAAAAGSASSAATNIGMVTGRYYGPVATGAGLTGKSLGEGDLGAVPFDIGESVTLDSIGINVTTALASQTARLGIYADSSGRVGTLILDAGTVSCATTGAKEIAISQALTAGRYWLACAKQGGGGAVGFMALNLGHRWPSIGSTSAANYTGNGTPNGGMTGGSTTGALPGTGSAFTPDGDKPVLVTVRKA